jgi:O-succinylbenzoate synthase
MKQPPSPMKIERVEQFRITMPLLRPFETSFGREDAADRVITAVYADGLVGWGEAPVGLMPLYSAETTETCWHVQRDMLIPLLLGNAVEHASDLPALFAPVRDHNMAKAGLEAAVWDLEAQRTGAPVADLVGGVRKRVDVGVSIGVQASVDALLDRIASFRAEGYRRIKVKIKPGWDEGVIAAIRRRFPGVPLMADANSAYTLDDAAMLTALDGFDLLMVEQPLAHDDLLDHAALQRRMKTPICLDESITTLGRAREALECGSCRIINIKPARVGGITASKRIHDLCEANDIPVWCGGMLETGIGRAHNLAVASLPNFTLPGDISASSRYWEQDIVEPAFTLNDDGTMDVPQGVGIGVEVQRDRLMRWTVDRAVYGG